MKKAVSTTLTAGVLAVSMLLTPFSALAAGGPIDLDAERAIPSAPQLGFADTEDHLLDNDGHEQDWSDELQSCHRRYCQGTDCARD